MLTNIEFKTGKGPYIVLLSCLLGLLLGTLLIGCQGGMRLSSELPLEVLGDIENPLSLHSLAEAPAILKIKYRDKTIEVIPLEKLLQEARPLGEHYEILYTAYDGFSALISNANLNESYLALNAEKGWEAINLNHPVSSNIKNIRDIVIISGDLSVDKRFNIIGPGRNITSLSVGEAYKKGYSVISAKRGTATVNHEGEELSADTYYRQKVIDLEDYVSLAGRDAVVVGEKGEVESLRQDGRFILNKNSLGYMAGDKLLIPRAKGIVLSPPAKSNTDVYHDVKTILGQGNQVLVILVDGLGYHQYEYARAHRYSPFLGSLPEPETAMAAYPSVTPVNLAASLTGELPHVNGVYERGIRQVNVPTIFGFGLEQGKSAKAIIGPIGTIELETEPIYSVDRNMDGSTDDEKTENALEIIADGHDLLFVHYKDVDRTGHDYGDLHENTLEDIRKLDGYIQQLVSNWNGKVLIYADHGMYETETGGDHGALVSESMFVPYWLFDTRD